MEPKPEGAKLKREGNELVRARLTDVEVAQILKSVDWSKLTEWETSFVKNVVAYWTQYNKISEKQRTRLAEVWKRLHLPPR